MAGQIRARGLDPPQSGELSSLPFRVWGTLCYPGSLRRDLPALHHGSSAQKGTFRFTVTQDSAFVPSVRSSLSPAVLHTDGPIRRHRARRGSMVGKYCSVRGVQEAPPPDATSFSSGHSGVGGNLPGFSRLPGPSASFLWLIPSLVCFTDSLSSWRLEPIPSKA